jgi:hypothetical protein
VRALKPLVHQREIIALHRAESERELVVVVIHLCDLGRA